MLQTFIPARNIPSLFVPITRIPYTDFDKVNVKRLKNELRLISNPSRLYGIHQGPENDGANGREPSTSAEIALEAAFRDVFGQKQRLSTVADFFQLGGDSLQAIKLVAASRDRGFEIDVQQVYGHPALKHLAAVTAHVFHGPSRSSIHDISRHTSSLTVSDDLRVKVAQQCLISPDTIEDVYPASPFQEGLAAAATLENHGSGTPHITGLYSATIVYSLTEDVDVPRLHRALAGVVSRNPIFRTTLAHSVEGTMQVVRRCSPDLQGKGEKQPIYFSWRIDQERHCLLLRVHHVIYDAWNIKHLLADVNDNYNYPDCPRHGRTPYRHFIEHLVSFDRDAAISYWGQSLRNVPVPQFPMLNPRHQARATHSEEHDIHLELASMKAARVSAATVMAAAMALTVSAYCFTDDVCYGMTLSGRDDPDLEEIAGPTLSTVPVRIADTSRSTNVRVLERNPGFAAGHAPISTSWPSEHCTPASGGYQERQPIPDSPCYATS